jgi:hypothetical protein
MDSKIDAKPGAIKTSKDASIDERREIVYSLLKKYYDEEYLSYLNLQDVENKALRNHLSKIDFDFYSHMRRFIVGIRHMKVEYSYPKMTMACVCFHAQFKKHTAVYGYLYSRMASSRHAKFTHEQVCTGATYDSQDGEYRSNTIRFSQFLKLFETYGEYLEPVEKMILSHMESGKLSFRADIYYPNTFTGTKEPYEQSINGGRFAVKLFMMSWFENYNNIMRNSVSSHINKDYIAIIKAIGGESVWNIYANDRKRYLIFQSIITNAELLDKIPVRIYPTCGQKLFPIAIIEAMRLEDVSFTVWREIYLNNLASNLVLNLISPSFAFIMNWFFIQNSNVELYSNEAMKLKFVQSDIAEDVAGQLREADKLNYTVNSEDKKVALNIKFLRLSRHIHRGVVYADSEIRLSDTSVCVNMENVGITVRNMSVFITQYPRMKKFLDTKHIFAKHMFEFIYSFYCMNTKLSLCHTDLHLNNVTFNPLYYETPDIVGEKLEVCYILENNTYAFVFNGIYSTVIDFSRAIIGDYARLEHEFSPRFAETYMHTQYHRIMHLIYQHFPDVLEHHSERVSSLLEQNFPLLFKIFTAVDTYAFIKELMVMFTDNEVTLMSKENLKTLKKIKKLAAELFEKNIEHAIIGRITSIDELEWPNLTIIDEIFSEYIMNPSKLSGRKVVEIFNYHNEVKYDIDDYASWPPILRWEYETKVREEHDVMTFTPTYERWLQNKDLDEGDKIQQHVQKFVDMEKDVIDFEPWMMS